MVATVDTNGTSSLAVIGLEGRPGRTVIKPFGRDELEGIDHQRNH